MVAWSLPDHGQAVLQGAAGAGLAVAVARQRHAVRPLDDRHVLAQEPDLATRGLVLVGSHDAVSRLRPKLIEQGLEPVGMAAAEFRTWLERDIAKWREVVRAANIRPD